MRPLEAVSLMVERSGLSPEEVSYRIGKNRRCLRDLFSRNGDPSTSTFAIIANVLGYDVVCLGDDDSFSVSPTDCGDSSAVYALDAFSRMSYRSGISQREASRSMGFDEGYLASKESGGHVPRMSLFAEIASSFGYRVLLVRGRETHQIVP